MRLLALLIALIVSGLASSAPLYAQLNSAPVGEVVSCEIGTTLGTCRLTPAATGTNCRLIDLTAAPQISSDRARFRLTDGQTVSLAGTRSGPMANSDTEQAAAWIAGAVMARNLQQVCFTQAALGGTPVSPLFTLDAHPTVRINGVFVPLQGLEQLRTSNSVLKSMLSQPIPGSPGRRHIVIHVPKDQEDQVRSKLSQRGISLLTRIGSDLWTARVAPSTFAGALTTAYPEDISNLGIGAIPARAKIEVSAPKRAEDAPPHARLPDGLVRYVVSFHEDVPLEGARLSLSAAGAQPEEATPEEYRFIKTLTAAIRPADLERVAGQDNVRLISPLPGLPVHQNDAGRTTARVDALPAPPNNLTGDGVEVMVWEPSDNGAGFQIDIRHPAFEGGTNRVTIGDPVTTVALNAHGTHIAGTIAGAGTGNAQTTGFAPAARIVSRGVAGPPYVKDFERLLGVGTLTLSNHSYGEEIGWNGSGGWAGCQSEFGRYTVSSRALDQAVWLARAVIVKSASNNRDDQKGPTQPMPTTTCSTTTTQDDCSTTVGTQIIDADCLDTLATSKNAIVVGALNQNLRPGWFSSYGPTDDGRIKPDLMAYGHLVKSAIPGFTCPAGSINCSCHILPNPPRTACYSTMTGTSMANPAVVGAVALLTERVRKLGFTPLSPEAVKALLIHTARDIAGPSAPLPDYAANWTIWTAATNPPEGAGPDYATGYGSIDVAAADALLRTPGGWQLLQGVLLKTGDKIETVIDVPTGAPEVRVTLAWTDRPAAAGAAAGAVLMNDLDLELVDPRGVVYTPWRLDPTQPQRSAVPSGGDDDTNNVEQVLVRGAGVVAGEWTVRVTAETITPSNPMTDPSPLIIGQSFAIVGVGPEIREPAHN